MALACASLVAMLRGSNTFTSMSGPPLRPQARGRSSVATPGCASLPFCQEHLLSCQDLQQLCIETLVEFDESQDLTGVVSSSERSSELTSPFAPEEKIQQIAQQECALDLQVKRVETSRRLYKGVTIKFGHGQDGSPARATILGFESLRATPLAFPCAQRFAVSSALRALEAYEANPMVTFPPQAAVLWHGTRLCHASALHLL